MRSATDCAPKTCKCGKRLPKPHVHGGELCYDKQSSLYMKWHCPRCDERLGVNKVAFRDWVIICTQCHTHYVWAYHETSNGCWKIRNSLPLMNTHEIVVVA